MPHGKRRFIVPGQVDSFCVEGTKVGVAIIPPTLGAKNKGTPKVGHPMLGATKLVKQGADSDRGARSARERRRGREPSRGHTEAKRIPASAGGASGFRWP